MSLTVHPDPQHPAGGFAFLELPGGSLPDGTVMVAIQDAFGDRWLAPPGDANGGVAIAKPDWQGERHDFGPYEVHRHDGADWVRIGPEIVNRIEEYTPLRIEVNGQAYDVTWPDDVPPRAGAAASGTIRPPVAAAVAPPVPPPVSAPPALEPEPDEDPEPPDADPDPDPASAGSRRRIWLMLGLVLLLLAAIAAVWVWTDRDEPADPARPAAATPDAGDDTCTYAALAALPGGFGRAEAALRDCGARVSPETALRLIEDAAARDEAGALLLFGTLYDGDDLDPRIENLIGLSFDDDPAQAAEYYARAVAAGSEPAKDRLSATCARLAVAVTTLEKGAYDDFCR